MRKKDRSKNALKHGAFSRELILPGESKKEYELLLAELEAEYSPSGPSESTLSIILRRSSGGKDACRFIGRPSWRSVSGRSSARTSHTI